MPRFFFDVDDGERQTSDEVGISLLGLDDVEQETRVLLENLSVPEVLGGRDRVFTALVRDQGGEVVYKGVMTLKIDRGTITR